MKKLYLVEVSDRDTGKVYERKCYWQYGRISRYCNQMYRKYGERVYCRVYEDCNFEHPVEEWGA